VGAFSVKENADRVIKKLMSSGFSPLVQTRTTRSSMHVIFIGGFADRNSPQSMISELRNKGLNPILKKNDNGSYSIILGKERSKERAEALKQKLTKLGIFTSLKQMKINMRMFIVRVGGFENNSNALKGQKKIEHLGYMGTVIRKKS
jgi:cell division septation protein DedD